MITPTDVPATDVNGDIGTASSSALLEDGTLSDVAHNGHVETVDNALSPPSKRSRRAATTSTTDPTSIKTVEQLATIIALEAQKFQSSKTAESSNDSETLTAGDYITYFNQVN